MLGNLPVPGRPTIWIIVGQGPVALAVGAGGGCLDIFSLICPFSSLSPSLWETARYRLKYCLKGPLNPKQPTNQHFLSLIFLHSCLFPVCLPFPSPLHTIRFIFVLILISYPLNYHLSDKLWWVGSLLPEIDVPYLLRA